MDRSPRIGWLWLAVLAVCSGCLFTHHSRKVLRENEQRRPVQFESEEARQAFDAGALVHKGREKDGKGSFFAIPFLLWYSRDEVLSDNAQFNDQVATCDTNGDGLISTAEAVAYHGKSRGEVAATASDSNLVQLENGSPRTAAVPPQAALPPGNGAVAPPPSQPSRW